MRALDPSYSSFTGHSDWGNQLQTEELTDAENSTVKTDSNNDNIVSVVCWIWSSLSLTFCCSAVCLAFYYRSGPDPWSRHPIALTLGKFADILPFSTWRDVAADINREYQEVDKFVTMLSAWNVRTVATQSWILRLGRYRVGLSHRKS